MSFKKIQLKNGVFFQTMCLGHKENHILTIDKNLEVIDNNVVRHVGTDRLLPKQKTPFQILLDEIIQSNFKLSPKRLDHIIRKVLSIPTLESNSRMHSEQDSDILDCWNDQSRRYFESVLAQKIINYFLSTPGLLMLLIQDLQKFYISEYQKEGDMTHLELVKNWQMIREKQDETKSIDLNDPNLVSFAAFRSNLLSLLDSGHFKNNKACLLALYDTHYLTHSLAKLGSYKSVHPQGKLKSYRENSEFYRPKNRGRVCGYGFAQGVASSHLGIMRSQDFTPYDQRMPANRKGWAVDVTRCPDRLYMRKPEFGDRRRKQSWLHQAFSNPYNSSYVNGLSGSTLLEINALLFYVQSVKNESYKDNQLSQHFLADNKHKLLKNYWLFIASVFVYIEGGHTFTEILSVFYLENIKSSLKDVLGEAADEFSLKALVFDNPNIYPLVSESLIDAAKYQFVINNKQDVHKELLQAGEQVTSPVSKP